jgi:ankyrin repeat protein
MYHTRKATVPLDKVYALLGMSSDDRSTAELKVDYEASWGEVFQKLIKFSLSEQISVSTWDGVEVAVIEAKSNVLGEVSTVREDATRDDRQHVDITWRSTPSHFDTKEKQSSHFTFQASAKAIKEGDVICLLQGASRPTIFRRRNEFLTIIMIAVPRTDDLRKRLASITTFPHDLVLVWDWDESRRKSQGGEDYADFINSRGVPRCPVTTCQCLDSLDKATRLWNLGLVLNRVGRYEEAVKNIRKAVEIYGIATALRSVDKTYLGHGAWREADEEALMVMDDLLVDDKAVAVEAEYKKRGQTPLSWAAEEGNEAVVKLLLDKGADTESKDGDGWTPLSRAAAIGREAVVKLLLATGKVNRDSKRDFGRTPLSYAAAGGHGAVVKMLLATGKVDIDSKDQHGRTPLSYAAARGHEAVVKLLHATGKVDIDSKPDYGQTPLSYAAKNGHEAVVKLLLATGKVNVDSEGIFCRTPLSYAAENGHEAVIKLLLATGKVDVNSMTSESQPLLHRYSRRTPLLYAAENGHEAVVKLLLATGKVHVDLEDMKHYRTPLSYAAENGHEAVVKLLLGTGKVDINSKSDIGWTPLLYAAAWGGHEAVVKLLLDKGADLETTDKYGQTLLSRAAQNGHEAVVKLLRNPNNS